MDELVEGEFKGFTIRMVSPEDVPRILEHLDAVYFQEETLMQLVGYTKEFGREISEVVRSKLARTTPANNLSFFAIDVRTNKFAGVRLTFACNKQNTEREPNQDEIHTPQHVTVLKFVKALSKKLNVFDTYDVKEYADMFFTSVAPEFRGQGLATEFYARSLRLIQAMGFPLVKCSVSNPYTLRAVEKLGFREVARVVYGEVEDEDGNPLFPNATENRFNAIMIKTFH